jgi:3-methyladenine DNA glycosylase AlkD
VTLNAEGIIAELKTMGSAKNVEGMARFGISTEGTLGIGVTALRKFASPIRKELRKNPEQAHALAGELWASGIHEGKQLAVMLQPVELVTPAQMDAWVADVDSWDVCDALAMDLFPRTPYAVDKALEWAHREPEFERRAAFALMASLARRRQVYPDEAYEPFFDLIKQYAFDDRNFVKKAVNWALRQIGKRNDRLLLRAIDVAREVDAQGTRSARWIAKDALRELLPKVRQV